MAIEPRSLVAPGVYRSGQPTAEEIANFAAGALPFEAQGKTIIRLNDDGEGTPEWERALVEGLGMKFMYIPLPGWLAPSHAQVAGIISILNDAADQPVLLHCYHGEDRTGCVIACYRIDHGMSRKDAQKEANEHGMNWISAPMRWFIRRWK